MTLSRNLSTLGQAVTTAGNLPTANLTGTIASAQLSGSYTGITGVGTLAAGSIPSSLVTGLTVGSTANTQTFTTTGTWYKPAGVSMAYVQIWGGGGGGASFSGNGGNGAGGGGGAYNEIVVPMSYLASSVTATVGLGGGAGGNGSGAIGGVGGTSSFALATAVNGLSTVYAYGGGGGGYGGGGGGGGSLGAGGNAQGGGGNGGLPGNGAVGAVFNTINIGSGGCPNYVGFGAPGLDGGGYGRGYTSYAASVDTAASRSYFGGGGGAINNTSAGSSVWGGGGGGVNGQSGGTSLFGGSGGAASAVGTVPGGGGGSTNSDGGHAGGAGKIIVTCW